MGNLSPAKLAPAVKIIMILFPMLLLHIMLAAQSSSSVCDRDPSTALVFVGTLTESKAMAGHGEYNSLKFHVTEILRGESSQEVSLLRENQHCDDPATNPVIGGSYLVRTHVSKGNIDPLWHCDQMRLADHASGELPYLRRGQKGETPAEVSFEARLEPYGYPWQGYPLPGTIAHVCSGGKQQDFVTDQKGLYKGPLAPGHYTLAIEFPTGYEPDPYGRCGRPEFNVVEHFCTSVALCAGPTASITAPLVGVDGSRFNVMSNVQLSLVTAEGQQFVQSVWPDENSNLVAERLVPGKYVLGLNTYLPVTRESPYPPTYYPGVSRRSDAEVITLEPGEHKVLPEMRIKKGTPCDIAVQVFDQADNPSPSTQLALFYLDYPHYYSDQETDANGKGQVYAVFPGPVFLRAEKPIQDQPVLESDAFEVDTCPAEPVRLKLMHPAANMQEPHGKPGLNPDDAGAHREAVGVELKPYLRHEYLGEVLANQHDLAGAIAEFRAALSLEPKFVLAHVRLGYALGDSGDFDGEIAEEREALRLNPRDDGAHVGLGFALGSKGDMTAAEAEEREALRLNPHNDQAHANLAWIFGKKGDLDAGIREERLALSFNPDNWMARDGLGNALGTRGDHEGAIDVFREALSRNPNDDIAHAGLGSVLNVQQKWQESVRENREAFRLNPLNAQAHANLGVALAGEGDVDGGVAELREALRQEPHNLEWRFNLGVVLEHKGDWNGAIPDFQESLRVNPQYARALTGLGVAFLHKGDPQSAIPVLREAIRLEPNDEGAHNDLAIALGQIGDLDGAIAERREVVRLNPNNLDARVFLGDTIGRKGDWDGDIAEQRAVLRVNPNSSNAHTALAWALGKKGDWDGDIAEEREALRLDPNQPNVHGDLGYALAHKGMFDQALAECQEALRLNPKSDDGHFCLGAVAEAKGDVQGALREYQKAIELNPNEPDYHHAYEHLMHRQNR